MADRLTPHETLAEDHRQAMALAQTVGAERLRKVLEVAAGDLERRILEAVNLRGLDDSTFTLTQMRATLAQVRQATKLAQAGIAKTALTTGAEAAEDSATKTLEYLRSANEHFSGVAPPLALEEAGIVDQAQAGVRASILRRLASSGEDLEGADLTAHPAKPGVLERYGMETLGHFEKVLQKGFITRKPWGEVRDELTQQSPFLQGAPAYWAERIVRTESMAAYNRGGYEATRAADDELGDMVKILAAHFDDRTAADSYAVHGQIRRPEQPFNSWFGPYQHPPNRPNDREIVVPHRIAWPIPPYLAWKTDGEVAARWKYDGRKGHPPARPNMTTVPLEEFGKKSAKAEPLNRDHGEPEIPERGPRSPQAAADEAQWHDPGIPEIPERGPRAPQAPVEDAEFEPKPILEPFDEPEPPKELDAANVLDVKTAGAKGSNEGGFYTGRDGVQRYVKFYGDASQAYSEHLSNQIYRDLGFEAPESATFEHEGKRAYASKVVSDLKTVQQVGLTEDTAKKVMRGFAADVLTANWDAVGTGLDNVGVVGDKVMRVDNGGSLLFRAKAGRKPEHLLNEITEWDKFLSPSSNPYYAQVASKAGVTKAADLGKDLVDQIDQIKKLRKAHGSWGAYVEKHAPGMAKADKKSVVGMLEARTKLLAAKVDEVKGAAKQAKIDAKNAAAAAKEAKKAQKEYAALAKKMGGAPPQTYESLAKDDAAAQKHFEAWHLHGHEDEASYRRMASNAIDGTEDHQSGPVEFTGSSYREIRAHEQTPGEPASGQVKQWAREIAQFMDKARPAPPGIVYRGITNVRAASLNALLTKPTFEFDATSSVSRKGSTSLHFAGGMQSRGDVFFVINHRSAVPVETISQHKSEKELFLRKGTNFRVTRRYRNASGGVVIEADELPRK